MTTVQKQRVGAFPAARVSAPFRAGAAGTAREGAAAAAYKKLESIAIDFSASRPQVKKIFFDSARYLQYPAESKIIFQICIIVLPELMVKHSPSYSSLPLLLLLRACPAIQAEGGEGWRPLKSPPFWTAFSPVKLLKKCVECTLFHALITKLGTDPTIFGGQGRGGGVYYLKFVRYYTMGSGGLGGRGHNPDPLRAQVWHIM